MAAKTITTDYTFSSGAGIDSVGHVHVNQVVNTVGVRITGTDTSFTYLLRAIDADGDSVFHISADRDASGNDAVRSYGTHFFGGTSTQDVIRIICRAGSGGSENQQEWRNWAGSTLAKVNVSGKGFFAGLDAQNNQIDNVAAATLVSGAIPLHQLNDTLSGHLHAVTHESGGTDEINVAGLVGLPYTVMLGNIGSAAAQALVFPMGGTLNSQNCNPPAPFDCEIIEYNVRMLHLDVTSVPSEWYLSVVKNENNASPEEVVAIPLGAFNTIQATSGTFSSPISLGRCEGIGFFASGLEVDFPAMTVTLFGRST